MVMVVPAAMAVVAAGAVIAISEKKKQEKDKRELKSKLIETRNRCRKASI